MNCYSTTIKTPYFNVPEETLLKPTVGFLHYFSFSRFRTEIEILYSNKCPDDANATQGSCSRNCHFCVLDYKWDYMEISSFDHNACARILFCFEIAE